MVKNYIKLTDVTDGWGCFLVCYRCECLIPGETELHSAHVSCDSAVWEEAHGDTEAGTGHPYQPHQVK